ncbi:MAG: hypothetical protein WC417_00710 [Candidatus Omnitrophota bacterium]|jgi:hypothetical protein
MPIREKTSVSAIQQAAVYGFFAVFLLLGLLIYKDYGISWDEPNQLITGKITMRYVAGNGDELFAYDYKNYGTAFILPLAVLEKIFNLTGNSRSLFMIRHLATFLLFFLGVVFFYKLCKYRFQSWKMGLAGALFLILSPRIFANSFYNPKDIPFLSLFIISVYTLIQYLNTPTLRKATLHALACAILIDIRIVGIIVPFFTFLFLLLGVRAKQRGTGLRPILFENALIWYLLLLAAFTIFFWPLLWRHPLASFMAAYLEMGRYIHLYYILYLGKLISSSSLPWHYLPVWIFISTPLFYLVFFLIGALVSLVVLLKNPIKYLREKRDDLLFLFWFFLPLSVIIVSKPVLYDDWRQAYFIYPALLLIAMTGMKYVLDLITVKSAFIIIAAISLAPVITFMIKNHPYQNVYFNSLAGRDMVDIKKKFELDYWGLSYRKALEYILATDKNKEIKICVANHPGIFNSFILPREERNRLVYVVEPEKAKYFLSNYRWHPEEYAFGNEYYSIKVGNAKIMTVYKL